MWIKLKQKMLAINQDWMDFVEETRNQIIKNIYLQQIYLKVAWQNLRKVYNNKNSMRKSPVQGII